jgi:hypothetical protein
MMRPWRLKSRLAGWLTTRDDLIINSGKYERDSAKLQEHTWELDNTNMQGRQDKNVGGGYIDGKKAG